MKSIGIGLIGAGFMGKCHALAFGAVKAVFPHVPRPRLEILADTTLERARSSADRLGFARATDDWRTLVEHSGVDVVSVTTPNSLHYEMALAAIAAGKHVYCEKPLAVTLGQAEEMAAAAARAGVRTLVGYNYLKNPAVLHAKALVEAGSIGRIMHFRGIFDEDYMADPAQPGTWRSLRREAGLGVLGDMGCHLVAAALELAGPIESVLAETRIVYTRHSPEAEVSGDSGAEALENEDIATALVRFENGCDGSLAMSRSAWGRKNRLAWEVHGEAGMLCFDQERLNELQLYEARTSGPRAGFRTILTGPAHPPYGAFVPAPGHGLGFNDLKVVEVEHLLSGIAGDAPIHPDFGAALEIERIIHAIDESARLDTRVRLPLEPRRSRPVSHRAVR